MADGGSSEDISMEEGEVLKPDGIAGVNGAGDPGGWKPIHFGLIGHGDSCAICAAMLEHLKQAMADGASSEIVDAVHGMLEKSHARLQLPMLSIDHWVDSLAPMIYSPPETTPMTTATWLTYLANTLAVEIATAEVAARTCNQLPGTRKEDLDYGDRQRRSRVRLLRDVVHVMTGFQSMAVKELFDPVSEETSQAIVNELPRRMRGMGDPRYPRRPVFPEFRTISTHLGDIICAVPSRPLSPFELLESEWGLILPKGAGGHTHIPGSLWNFVPHVACTEEQLRKCTWSLIYEDEKEVLRLFIEAAVVPWLERSPQQRSLVDFLLAVIIRDHGEDAAKAIYDAIGIVDLDEQTEFWARSTSDVPHFVNRWVVENVWHWDETGLAIWQFMARVFPHYTTKAMTVFRYAKDRESCEAPRPGFRPIEYTGPMRGSPPIYMYSQVHHHLVNVCGVEIADLKHFFELAKGWDSITRQNANVKEDFRWNDLVQSGRASTVGQLPILFEPSDPPISSISPQQLLATIDRRREPARHAPPAIPTHPRNAVHQAGGADRASSSSSSQASATPASTQPSAAPESTQSSATPLPASPAVPTAPVHEYPFKKKRRRE